MLLDDVVLKSIKCIIQSKCIKLLDIYKLEQLKYRTEYLINDSCF